MGAQGELRITPDQLHALCIVRGVRVKTTSVPKNEQGLSDLRYITSFFLSGDKGMPAVYVGRETDGLREGTTVKECCEALSQPLRDMYWKALCK